MKVLLSWLREFAPLRGDPVELGELMSDLGMEVDRIAFPGRGLEGVVVARVLATRPIPGAEKVQQVIVDAGDGEGLEVGCGAFNMAVGDLVPLAKVGATMPGGAEIRRRKIAGVWSNGMLCSARELGLGADHSGILVLGPGPAPGEPFGDAVGLPPGEARYELEINPNRPDAMSVAGVARDLAARQGVAFSLPSPAVEEFPAGPEAGLTVEISDPDLCGRFVVRALRGVRVGPSHARIATRLAALGMRPVNNVVDVSNYVMAELGQPSHPYDLSRLGGPGFRIRRARPGEQIVALDGLAREMSAGELVICDASDSPVGIAGVMGGAACEITRATTEVAVEMAWFLPISVARTSRRLKLRTEAAARFEKGCDPEVIDLAMARFAELLAPAGARLEAGSADQRGDLPARPRVRLRVARANRLLGTDLPASRMATLLGPIGFRTVPAGEDLEVEIPSWRYDCAEEIDVVEELARHHGYAAIGRRLPSSTHIGSLSARQQQRRALRAALVGLGLSEAMPLPFLAPGQLKRCGLPEEGIQITNPLVAEESVLRTSLLPGLLTAIGYNARHRNHGVGLFEIGHVFNRPADPAAALPDEREHLGVAWAGRDAADAVRAWRRIAASLRLGEVAIRNGEQPGLHPTRAGALVAGEVALGRLGEVALGRLGEVDPAVLGRLGEVDPAVLEALQIPERVAWLELDLAALEEMPRRQRRYRAFSQFPSSDLDLAFEVDEAVPAAAVEDALRRAGGDLLWSVRLFDVYRGPGVAEGRRSLAYTLRLQAFDRTLTDEDVAAVRQRCVQAVEAALPATLRG